MIDTTRTSTLLLEGLHDSENRTVWIEFDARYRPIIEAIARRMGLDASDASDVAQETMLQFLKEYTAGRYDRQRARLRAWLVALARTRVAAVYRARARRRIDRGESAVVQLPDEAEMTVMWDTERRTVILREAIRELRSATKLKEHTIQAFELLTMQSMPPAAVAEQLGISVDEVYLAKSRVAKRLREIIATIEAAFDESGA